MQNKGCLKFYENHSLSHVSTFGIGGKARFFAVPSDMTSFICTYKAACENGHVKVVGNASNMLFDDFGFTGTVISTVRLRGLAICNEMREIFPNLHYGCDVIAAECGVMLPILSAFALKNGYGGFSGLCSIPGTVGGALCLNAGAYGAEIADNLLGYELFMPQSGKTLLCRPNPCEFAYRKSPIPKSGGVLLRAYFEGFHSDKAEIGARIEKNKAHRKETQPIGMKSAGSYFKRPSVELSAGKIIDSCGLKGLRIGGARVSEKHAGFIVNESGLASASDVLALARCVKRRVCRITGIRLTEEVEFLPFL